MTTDRLVESLIVLFDLALVVLGFSLIIVIHEAGHFFAARWAGIRVLAFAVGFGPALVSFRKGLGFRRGSSEREYQKLQQDSLDAAHARRDSAVSPTEYRLNILPFGGYVKMLGQDDADPSARSDEPDSYQNARVWKRMVVISAGVVANVITAAVLFIAVFNFGLLSEPAKIGEVSPGKPAAIARASNAAERGVTTPGLKPGDVILSIDGEIPSHFNDIAARTAMASRNMPLAFDVQRPGVNGVLHFSILPVVDPETGMFSIGASPAATGTLLETKSARFRQDFASEMASRGMAGLQSGMRIASIDGKPARTPYDVQAAISAGNGAPVTVAFTGDDGRAVDVHITPSPALQSRDVPVNDKRMVATRELLGFTPVLMARSVLPDSPAGRAGLKDGDIFVQIGGIEWPSVPAGIAEVRSHSSRDLRLAVYRKNDAGAWAEHDLGSVRVSSEGLIGFTVADTAFVLPVLASWPTTSGGGATPSGAGLPVPAGSRIVEVDGKPIGNFGDLRSAVQTVAAATPVNHSATLSLKIALPLNSSGRTQTPVETVSWTIPPDELASVKSLGWESPLDSRFFQPEQFLWRSSGIADAIRMGLHETRRVMTMTYLTFARLFQGTVKVEHLKGPVGIAHVGVMIADRGVVWLLFFMALISVNLAVVNFLPIPIADGGHMVFLIYEQFTGRQPPVAVQNFAAIVGLVLIGTLFIFVTFHDVEHVVVSIRNFFGG